jgi:hypothetical protein
VDVRINATHEVVDMEREGIDLAIRDSAVNRAPPGSVTLVGEHLAPVCSPEYLKEARAAKRPSREARRPAASRASLPARSDRTMALALVARMARIHGHRRAATREHRLASGNTTR